MSIPSRSEYSRTALQDSGPSHSNNGAYLTGAISQESPGPASESGDEKDNEIARLKRAYHDAVMDTNNKKASAKTNT